VAGTILSSPGKIGLFGISLGGIISSITAGVDERVRASVLTVMGATHQK